MLQGMRWEQKSSQCSFSRTVSVGSVAGILKLPLTKESRTPLTLHSDFTDFVL